MVAQLFFSLLPSEICRLILGYLNDLGCTETCNTFFHECSNLDELRTQFHSARDITCRVGGVSLVNLLEDYVNVVNLINEELESEVIAFPMSTASVCRPGEAVGALRGLLSRKAGSARGSNSRPNIVISAPSVRSGPPFPATPPQPATRFLRISSATSQRSSLGIGVNPVRLATIRSSTPGIPSQRIAFFPNPIRALPAPQVTFKVIGTSSPSPSSSRRKRHEKPIHVSDDPPNVLEEETGNPSTLPTSVADDEVDIERVISNLVANAETVANRINTNLSTVGGGDAPEPPPISTSSQSLDFPLPPELNQSTTNILEQSLDDFIDELLREIDCPQPPIVADAETGDNDPPESCCASSLPPPTLPPSPQRCEEEEEVVVAGGGDGPPLCSSSPNSQDATALRTPQSLPHKSPMETSLSADTPPGGSSFSDELPTPFSPCTAPFSMSNLRLETPSQSASLISPPSQNRRDADVPARRRQTLKRPLIHLPVPVKRARHFSKRHLSSAQSTTQPDQDVDLDSEASGASSETPHNRQHPSHDQFGLFGSDSTFHDDDDDDKRMEEEEEEEIPWFMDVSSSPVTSTEATSTPQTSMSETPKITKSSGIAIKGKPSIFSTASPRRSSGEKAESGDQTPAAPTLSQKPALQVVNLPTLRVQPITLVAATPLNPVCAPTNRTFAVSQSRLLEHINSRHQLSTRQRMPRVQYRVVSSVPGGGSPELSSPVAPLATPSATTSSSALPPSRLSPLMSPSATKENVAPILHSRANKSHKFNRKVSLPKLLPLFFVFIFQCP
uniref:LisH domain-containing protein n=1 Tax=Mesocestoides corti TaxID=53468 RepID=A0A5K3EQM4_MESCO